MASWDSSRFIIPFMPSLFHLSSVKISARFFHEFDVNILDTVLTEIQQGNSSISKNTTDEDREQSRAKESLLFIPAHLRETVVRGVHGRHHAIENWRRDHRHIFNFKDEDFILDYRSDGSINAVETAQNLVLDKKICIMKRFKMACMYCFEQSVRTLWAAMEASGQTENFEVPDNFMTRFWVRWLREGSRVPWTQAARVYLFPPTIESLFYARFSAFLPLLRPEDRQKFLDSLQYTSFDDLRFCLYAVTKEEEEHIVKGGAISLLLLHLSWPLQTLFHETAEKLWNYIDKDSLRRLLSVILDSNNKWKDFNYSELFEVVWNRSSIHFRESAREWPNLIERIASYFVEKKRLRESAREWRVLIERIDSYFNEKKRKRGASADEKQK